MGNLAVPALAESAAGRQAWAEAPLRIIAGRVAYLLHTAPAGTLPPDGLSLTVDPRLAIPLCAVAAQGSKLKTLGPGKRNTLTEKLVELLGARSASGPAFLEPEREFVATAVNELTDDSVWRYLFDRLAPPNQIELLRRLLQHRPIPEQRDWRNIFRPIRYTFDKSLQARSFKLGLFAFVSLALWQMSATVLEAPLLVTGENGFILLLGLALTGGLLALSGAALEAEGIFGVIVLFGFLLAGPVAGTVVGTLSGNFVAGEVVAAVSFAVNFAVTLAFTVALTFVIASGPTVRRALGLAIVAGVAGAVGGAVGFAVGGAVAGAIGVAVSGAISGAVACVVVLVFARVDGVGSGTDVTTLGVVVGAAVVFAGVVGAVALPAVYVPTAWLYEQWGWVGAGAFWAAWLAWVVGFPLWGAHLERRAKNPLQGLLDREGTPNVRYRGIGRAGFGLLKWTLTFLRVRGG
ncbi:MAG: hypothetical protein H0U97_01005 [Gammaproteobacteria bacterium]|nr:hypothetical protein [Gammaproteobacteria bacterium]